MIQYLCFLKTLNTNNIKYGEYCVFSDWFCFTHWCTFNFYCKYIWWLDLSYLFAIIFVETGAVILPFLPEILYCFAAAALSANSMYHLNIWIFVFYFLCRSWWFERIFIGRAVGNALTEHHIWEIYKQAKMAESKEFFDHYGSISITFARYMPIIRTFAPFVAGGSNFRYQKFIILIFWDHQLG